MRPQLFLVLGYEVLQWYCKSCRLQVHYFVKSGGSLPTFRKYLLRPFYQSTLQRILGDNTSTDTVLSHIFHLASSTTEICLQFCNPQKTRIPGKKAIRLKLFMHLILVRVFFYICCSVHRNCRLMKSNKMQQDAYIYLMLHYSTCFGCPSSPSSGVHNTVVAASGTDHTVWGASVLIRSASLITSGGSLLPR